MIDECRNRENCCWLKRYGEFHCSGYSVWRVGQGQNIIPLQWLQCMESSVGIEHYSIVVATMYGELVGIEHYSIVVATMYGELGRDRTLFHCSGYNVWRVGQGQNIVPLQWLQCAYSILKSAKDYFNVQGDKRTPSTLPTTCRETSTPQARYLLWSTVKLSYYNQITQTESESPWRHTGQLCMSIHETITCTSQFHRNTI